MATFSIVGMFEILRESLQPGDFWPWDLSLFHKNANEFSKLNFGIGNEVRLDSPHTSYVNPFTLIGGVGIKKVKMENVIFGWTTI